MTTFSNRCESMNAEDKQFLAELQKELNTQDNDATRNPIWCIMDKEIVLVPDDCGDFKVVTDDERIKTKR